jgi:hypothetical protein
MMNFDSTMFQIVTWIREKCQKACHFGCILNREGSNKVVIQRRCWSQVVGQRLLANTGWSPGSAQVFLKTGKDQYRQTNDVYVKGLYTGHQRETGVCRSRRMPCGIRLKEIPVH